MIYSHTSLYIKRYIVPWGTSEENVWTIHVNDVRFDMRAHSLSRARSFSPRRRAGLSQCASRGPESPSTCAVHILKKYSL